MEELADLGFFVDFVAEWFFSAFSVETIGDLFDVVGNLYKQYIQLNKPIIYNSKLKFYN